MQQESNGFISIDLWEHGMFSLYGDRRMYKLEDTGHVEQMKKEGKVMEKF
jgi:hypothetical protein